jgi:hypothetical protein
VAANKIQGIRAGLCHDTYSAHQGVEHDQMNVLVLGSRVIGEALARSRGNWWSRSWPPNFRAKKGMSGVWRRLGTSKPDPLSSPGNRARGRPAADLYSRFW